MTIQALQAQLKTVLQPWLGNYKRADGKTLAAICIAAAPIGYSFDQISTSRMECVIDPLTIDNVQAFLGGGFSNDIRYRVTLKAWPQINNPGYAMCLNDARTAIYEAWPATYGTDPFPATSDAIPQVILFIPNEDPDE